MPVRYPAAYLRAGTVKLPARFHLASKLVRGKGI